MIIEWVKKIVKLYDYPINDLDIILWALQHSDEAWQDVIDRVYRAKHEL